MFNRTAKTAEQNELRAAISAAHIANDIPKYNELLAKHQAIDTEFAEADAADARAKTIADMEARAEQPAGRVTEPAGSKELTPETEPRSGKEYEAEFRKWVKSSGKYESRVLSISSDSDGGYTLMPSRLEQEIIKPEKNLAVIQGLSKYELIDGRISSQGVNLSSITGNSQKGVAVTLSTESSTGESFTFSKRKMRSNPFTHWMKVPNAMLDFSFMSDPMGWFINELKERKAVADDYRFIYGDGIDQPLGLAVADPDGIATGRNFTATASGVFTYLLLEKAYFNQKPGHRARSQWVFDTIGLQQIMGLLDSQLRPLDSLGLNTSGVRSLFGKPVTESNNLAPTQASANVFNAGQVVGFFGDFNRYQIIESKNVSVKLDPYVLSNEDVTVVYIRSWQDAMPLQSEAFTRLIAA